MRCCFCSCLVLFLAGAPTDDVDVDSACCTSVLSLRFFAASACGAAACDEGLLLAAPPLLVLACLLLLTALLAAWELLTGLPLVTALLPLLGCCFCTMALYAA